MRQMIYKWGLIFVVCFLGYNPTLFSQIDPLWWDEVKEQSRSYLRAGDYQQALYLVEQALAKMRHSKDAAYYYAGLGFMSKLYETMGNHPMAIKYAKKRLRFASSSAAQSFAKAEQDRLGLAKLYMQLPDWKKAEQELDSLRILLGPQLVQAPTYYAEIVTLLGETYIQQGRYEEAVQSFEGAAAIILKQYGGQHLVYADALNRMVYAYMQTQDYEKALHSSLDALKIYQTRGRQEGICAFTLNNMAVAAHRLGKRSAAENYYKESLEIYTKIYGAEHPNCVSIRNNLGILYEQTGQKQKAKKLLTASIRQLLLQIEHYYQNVSELERLYFYRTKIVNNVEAFYSFVSRQADSSLLLQMQEISLRTKNAASYSSTQLKNIVLSEGKPELLKIYKEWFKLRQLISQIYALPQEQIRNQRINIRQLELEAQELERKMAEKSTALTKEFQSHELNSNSLQKKLKDGEAAIDFIHFHYRAMEGWTDSIVYYALLNRAGEKLPKLIALTTERELRQILRREVGRDPFNGQMRMSYINHEGLNKRLYQAVWAPLEAELKEVEHIHLSPSGWLCQLAFGAVRDTNDNYLGDRYNLHYYAAMRDFIQAVPSDLHRDSLNKTAILVGGVDFDLELGANSNTALALETAESADALWDVASAEAWQALPESKKEVEGLEGQLTQFGFECRLLTDINAREDSLKKLLLEQPPTILHLATHGYFIPTPRRYAAAQELRGLRDKLQYEPHPLWRSGLLLAGANTTWLAKGTVEGLKDGILPAYDIAAMHLKNTELVVLSACQTARGDIDNTEGVQGLQSAFRQAGVRYQLLTLWNVSDEASAKMMELFYRHYLNGKTIPEAFKAARKELRALKEFSSPFYWGAFILIE